MIGGLILFNCVNSLPYWFLAISIKYTKVYSVELRLHW